MADRLVGPDAELAKQAPRFAPDWPARQRPFSDDGGQDPAEYVPRAATQAGWQVGLEGRARRAALVDPVVVAGRAVFSFRSRPDGLAFTAEVPPGEGEAAIRMRMLYWPALNTTVGRLSADQETGLVLLHLPAGRHEGTVAPVPTTAERLGFILTAIGCFVWVLCLAWLLLKPGVHRRAF
jgi:hypothetical protein